MGSPSGEVGWCWSDKQDQKLDWRNRAGRVREGSDLLEVIGETRQFLSNFLWPSSAECNAPFDETQSDTS